jgi:two-component system sensor histidine kinase/response regulator
LNQAQLRGEPAGAPAPILVVDDYEANTILAIRLLAKLGYSAIAVRNGLEAVEATARGGHPLILMDCQMPVMDGFEATRAIRAREWEGHERLPIIAMTASVTESQRDAYLDAGMTDIVTKPVMIDVLREVLDRWHPAGQGAAFPSRTAHHARATKGMERGLDIVVLRRLGDDLGAEALSRFLDVYLRELPGREAAILQAVDDHTAEALRMAAHALKSPSAAVGASELARVCSELETLGREGRPEAADDPVKRLRAECEAVAAALEAERATLRL